MRVGVPGRLGQAERAQDAVHQPGPGLQQVGPDLDQHQRRHHDRQDEDILRDGGRASRHVRDHLRRGELGDQGDEDAAADQDGDVLHLGPEGRGTGGTA